ncbi:MAG: hypothetical protein EA412_01170 [Chitinophagaceae bacterium]|nr:MAG: hypothetical protein EA412_01170 [Chitinophagaceae bacterium]
MRNTTKLKAILLKYVITLDMDDDNNFTMILTDKVNGNAFSVEANNYSSVISKAYSLLLKELKKEENSGF